MDAIRPQGSMTREQVVKDTDWPDAGWGHSLTGNNKGGYLLARKLPALSL